MSRTIILRVTPFIIPVLVTSLIAALLLSSCSKREQFSMKLVPVESNGKWGYIDQQGKYVINPQFEGASVFVDGVARVRSADGKIGYIDENGKFVVNPTFKDGTDFSGGLACVVAENGSPEYVTNKGQSKFTVSSAEFAGIFSEGLAPVQISGEWGFINDKGELTIPAQFDEVREFSEGLAAVRLQGDYGYVDKKGQITINYQFKYAGRFKAGKAVVGNGSLYGYIGTDGKYIINPQFDGAGEFSEGLAPVRQGNMEGYIDENGKISINPQFSSAGPFVNGMAPVASGSKWGFIDKDGKYVINPQFDYASQFYGKIAIVLSAGRIGIIDRDGRFVVNPQFDSVNLLTETSKRVQSDYFDVQGVVNFLLDDTDASAFRKVAATSTLKDLLEAIDKNLKRENLGHHTATLSSPIKINEQASLGSLVYRFDAGPYDIVGQTYTYRDYWGNLQTRSSGTQEVPKDNAKVTGLSLQLLLTGRGYGKCKLVADALKSQLTAKTSGKLETWDYSFLISTAQMKCSVRYDQSNMWVNVNFPYVSVQANTPPPIEQTQTQPTTYPIATITGSGVRFRSEPTLNGAIISKFAKGTQVEVLERLQGWVKIKYKGKVGYVSADFITK